MSVKKSYYLMKLKALTSHILLSCETYCILDSIHA